VYPLLLTLLSATPTVSAAPLRLYAAHPPVDLGGGRYRFGERAEFSVLPAVVIELEPGATLPAGFRSLGGPFGLRPATSPAAAVSEALGLLGAPGLRSAFPDVAMPMVRRSFDDPSYGGQWYLEEIELQSLFDLSLGDPAIRAAVLDSGIDIAHADLAAGVFDPYDAWSDDADPSPDPGEYCGGPSTDICDTHGTSVSGIVAARANNGVDIVGICSGCTLVPVKLLGEGSGAMSVTIAAFEHAIAADAAVINNSWGYVRPTTVPEPIASVIHRAATETRGGLGAVVVFAAGNDDRELQDDEIEGLPDVLCVSALDSYGQPTAYTNSGASVDVAAPSATVTLTAGEGITTTFGGTSAAAPVVSGVAALALSIRPDLSAAELTALIIDTAQQSPIITPDEDGHHDVFGYGLIDPPALAAALTGAGDSGEPADTAAPADPADSASGDEKGGCGCQSAEVSSLFPALAGLLLAGRRRLGWTLRLRPAIIRTPAEKDPEC